jgi:CubicO group peptidase (beta-lactamase class C family)
VEKLKVAREYSATISTDAVILVVDGQILDEWGATSLKHNVHSVRKSLLNSIYGIYVHAGRIDLQKTLGELGIDDNEPSLTEEEKRATVRDLLMARSGVYHAALYESPNMKKARPARHSHQPGSFWYYNNWDFNVLGEIFERAVKNSIFREFNDKIALPTQMEDFVVEDGDYVTGPDSVHPAYPFRMTARDLARFGLLFLRLGVWRGNQVVPSEWVRESTMAYSDAGTYPGEGGGAAGGYGYLWWTSIDGKHFPNVTMPDGSYSARGSGGQYIIVVPAYDLIVVHMVDTDIEDREVSVPQFSKLLQLILDSKIVGH